MLGSEGYGVVVLVGLIPTYLTFADVGMGFASTKFGSEAFGQGAGDREAEIVRTAALIAFVASLPFGIAIFVFSDLIAGQFNVPTHLLGDASLALKFASVTFVSNVLINVLNTPQLARLRMDLNTMVTAGFRILGAIAMPIVLYLGGSIASAVFVLMLASVLTLIGHIFVSGRLNEKLFGLTIDVEVMRPLLKYGSALALSGVAAVLLVNLEKLVLTRTTSVQVLAYYSVAFMFANMATMFSQAMGQSLMPAFSQLLMPDKKNQLNDIFVRALRVNMFSLLPILAILCVIAKPFFTIWAGEDFGRESTAPFYLLLIGLFFNLNAYTPAGLLLAAGRTDILAKMYWIELVPYVAVTAFLTYRFGAPGAAAAWSLRVIVDAAIFIWLAKTVVRVQTRFSEYSGKLVIGLLILSFPTTIAVLFDVSPLWPVLVLIPSLALYAIMLWKSLLDPDEKAWVNRNIGRIQKIALLGSGH